MTKEFQSIIKNMMSLIAEELCKLKQSYTTQRAIISNMFDMKEEYNVAVIQKRLVVIDSLYSTNAGYSYFSFEEMADKIFSLGSEREAREYFYGIVNGGSDDKKLFNEQYGIQKNLKEGAKQMSLLSKYAYYALIADREHYPLGFPIYDSLAKAMYPRVMRHFEPNCKQVRFTDNITIEEYVKALDNLRLHIFGNSKSLFKGMQQFDILDAYLWRMGKIDGGNLSLLLSRKDYETFIRRLKLEVHERESDREYRERIEKEEPIHLKTFNIDDIILRRMNASSFDGLSNGNYLKSLFEHWQLYIKK